MRSIFKKSNKISLISCLFFIVSWLNLIAILDFQSNNNCKIIFRISTFYIYATRGPASRPPNLQPLSKFLTRPCCPLNVESYGKMLMDTWQVIDVLLGAVLGSFRPISQTTHEDGDDVVTVDRGNMAVIRGCQHVPYSRPPADIHYLLNGTRLDSARQY